MVDGQAKSKYLQIINRGYKIGDLGTTFYDHLLQRLCLKINKHLKILFQWVRQLFLYLHPSGQPQILRELSFFHFTLITGIHWLCLFLFISSNLDGYVAFFVAGIHIPVGFYNLFQGVLPINHRLDFSRLN